MSTQTKIRVGVLGAGQLALMLAEAAAPLGIEIICAGASDDCAHTAARIIPTDLTSPDSVRAFAAHVDLLTLESENIDAAVLAALPADKALAPNLQAVAIAQDRLLEKNFLRTHGIPTAPYAEVNNQRDLAAALAELGEPAILKTRRMGYDGKGQFRLTSTHDLDTAWDAIAAAPAILEGFVAFDAEVSLLGARGIHAGRAETTFYPLTRNTHAEGILRISRAPYENAALQQQAEAHMRTLLTALDYVGVLAIEFFVVGQTLIVNELAPRVHNSGHWTIEGAATSQFAQHLRAITSQPLGATTAQPTVMLNCIGTMPPLAHTLAFPELARHDYGKAPRPARKVGHLTFPAADTDAARVAIAEWKQRLHITE